MIGRLVLGLLVAALLVGISHGALTHQYTFNDGTADDSVGSADGDLPDLFDSGIALGRLQLGGATGYLELPGATIGINSYANASFEGWFNYADNGNWERLYDFGTTDPNVANNGADYVFFTPQGGGNFSRQAIHYQDEMDVRTEQSISTDSALSFGAQHHVVSVYDDSNDMMQLYIDGALAASGDMTLTLADLSNENAWVGRSLFAADAYLQGAVNEFNIYNHALTEGEVAANFAAGPVGGSDGPVVTINRDSGEIALSNTSSDVQMTGYSITSASGALDPDAWVPITGNKDAPPSGDGSFDSDNQWNIVAGPPAGNTNTLLAEEEPFGDGGTLGAVSFGPAWRKYFNEDVQFSFNAIDTDTFALTTVIPKIVWEGNGGEPFSLADLNTDGDVDENDWLLFADNHLVAFADGIDQVDAHGLGDLDGDLDNDFIDFRAFQGAFDDANGVGAFAALAATVPEPATWALALGAALVLVCFHARRTLGDRRLCGVVAARRLGCGLLALLVLSSAMTAAHAQLLILRDDFDVDNDYTSFPTGPTDVDPLGMWHGVHNLNAGGSNTENIPIGAPTDLNFGMDGVAWENNNAAGPMLYRNIPEREFRSVRAKISAQTEGFWSLAGVIARVPGPITDGAGDGSENWAASWSFRHRAAADTNPPGAVTHQAISTIDSAEVETNFDPGENGTDVTQLTYMRLDNLGGGEFEYFRSADGIDWISHPSGTLVAPNLAGSTLEIGAAAGAIGALADATVQFDWVEIYAQEPIPPEEDFSVHVNTTTGATVIRNNKADPITFDYYTIDSPGGALSTTGWNSLTDQDDGGGGSPPADFDGSLVVDGPDLAVWEGAFGVNADADANSDGQSDGADFLAWQSQFGDSGGGLGWSESGASDSELLSELSLERPMTLAPGEEVSLGDAFDPSVFGSGVEGDLEFNYATTGSAGTSFGGVVYDASSPAAGVPEPATALLLLTACSCLVCVFSLLRKTRW